MKLFGFLGTGQRYCLPERSEVQLKYTTLSIIDEVFHLGDATDGLS